MSFIITTKRGEFVGEFATEDAAEQEIDGLVEKHIEANEAEILDAAFEEWKDNLDFEEWVEQWGDGYLMQEREVEERKYEVEEVEDECEVP